jgi:hypothetical protein
VKRASYRAGIEWIALNDNAAEQDTAAQIAGYISSLLLADLFDVESSKVGEDVFYLRRKIARDAAHAERSRAEQDRRTAQGLARRWQIGGGTPPTPEEVRAARERLGLCTSCEVGEGKPDHEGEHTGAAS